MQIALPPPPTETRGNPFSSYTPQQYGSFSRTSVSGGNCTYSGRDGSNKAGEMLTADSKKEEEEVKFAKAEEKASSPVKTICTGRHIG